MLVHSNSPSRPSRTSFDLVLSQSVPVLLLRVKRHTLRVLVTGLYIAVPETFVCQTSTPVCNAEYCSVLTVQSIKYTHALYFRSPLVNGAASPEAIIFAPPALPLQPTAQHNEPSSPHGGRRHETPCWLLKKPTSAANRSCCNIQRIRSRERTAFCISSPRRG